MNTATTSRSRGRGAHAWKVGYAVDGVPAWLGPAEPAKTVFKVPVSAVSGSQPVPMNPASCLERLTFSSRIRLLGYVLSIYPHERGCLTSVGRGACGPGNAMSIICCAIGLYAEPLRRSLNSTQRPRTMSELANLRPVLPMWFIGADGRFTQIFLV